MIFSSVLYSTLPSKWDDLMLMHLALTFLQIYKKIIQLFFPDIHICLKVQEKIIA